ncbi:hypothetical protein BOTBODRAFT_638946 [Botryobasidium botryosum FD-172 SS1]|uniref:N-acetyltransferase domain-containing protein n=1 Tax=Botryobasidium botryosum (strain FD-172 SS1) TaxID=930990 RepID=A0A067MT29_BOTB1|nr:hypothetical protein BOTBODRAFT_638946 [Botryobasidium botryosum FD-172 SS1]
MGTQDSRHRARKRTTRASSKSTAKTLDGPSFSLQPLFDLASYATPEEPGLHDFSSTLEPFVNDFLEARAKLLLDSQESSLLGEVLRPVSRSDARSIIQNLDRVAATCALSPAQALLRRRLKTPHVLLSHSDSLEAPSKTLRALPHLPSPPPPNPEILTALYGIQTTPYANSFASRVHGRTIPVNDQSSLILRDWESRSPWMDLMHDIRDHYSLKHPEREQPLETLSSIDYVTLSPFHLPQIHDLLRRTFWPGIDVSDSLQHSPETCTIVATYKLLVVGAAFLSAPDEPYITYIVVRSGWEDCGIATFVFSSRPSLPVSRSRDLKNTSFMLHHLISTSTRDITLHVSANNPAMLLYNRFGFKAEEFVVGFYEDHLHNQSTSCKNALRLRLRR